MIIVFGVLLVLSLLLCLGESIHERDWPRDTARFAFWFAVIFALACSANAAQIFRVDPNNVMTTAGNAPPYGSPAVYAVAGATVQLCTDAACSVPAQTYTDVSGNTLCPINAPVTWPSEVICRNTTGPRGQFGFWIAPGTYWYKVTTLNGQTFGNFPITSNTAGVTSATAGTGISVSGDGTGNITITNTGVITFNGRAGPVVPTTGDYTAAQVTNAVSTAGSYADPAWITSLAFSKLTGVPALLPDTGTNGLVYRSGLSTARPAAAADIFALFTGCSGTDYPGYDGACHAAGSGGGGLPSGSQTQQLQVQPNTGGTLTYRFTDPLAAQASDYNFPAQSPAGTLAAGANSITLAPVPLGVNHGDTGHYLYVSGTGTPESCLISGGGGSSGDNTGSIVITCANTHSAGWTIASSSAGVAEALNASAGNVQVSNSFTLYAPFTIGNAGQHLIGAKGVTITIPSTFPLAASQVILINQPRAGVSNLNILYTQPDSTSRASMTAYPPAIDIQAVDVAIERVIFSNAWDAIRATTGNPQHLLLRDIGICMFDVGVDLDGIYDTTYLDNVRIWDGHCSTSNQHLAERTSVGGYPIAFRVGRDDGGQWKGLFADSATGILGYRSGLGEPGGIIVTDFQEDMGGGQAAALHMTAGTWTFIGGGFNRACNTAGCQFVLQDGPSHVTMSGVYFHVTNPDTTQPSVIEQAITTFDPTAYSGLMGQLILTGNWFGSYSVDLNMIKQNDVCAGGYGNCGTMLISGNHFYRTDIGSTYVHPTIWRVNGMMSVTGNDNELINTHASMFVQDDAVGAGGSYATYTGNALNGWDISITHPGYVSAKYGNSFPPCPVSQATYCLYPSASTIPDMYPIAGATFATLSAINANGERPGTFTYCTDCSQTSPCTAGGTGALAVATGYAGAHATQWSCQGGGGGGGGGIGGSGTANTLTAFTAPTSVGNSSLTDNGTSVSTSENFSAAGSGAFGTPGTPGCVTLGDATTNVTSLCAPTAGYNGAWKVPSTAGAQHQVLTLGVGGQMGWEAPSAGGTAFAAAATLGVPIFAACSGAVTTAINFYLFQGGGAVGCASATAGMGPPMPYACTAGSLYMKASTGAGSSGDDTVTLTKNGSDTAVTCALPSGVGAVTCSDLTHTVTFAAGDYWAVKVAAQASDTIANVRAGFVCK